MLKELKHQPYNLFIYIQCQFKIKSSYDIKLKLTGNALIVLFVVFYCLQSATALRLNGRFTRLFAKIFALVISKKGNFQL